MTKKEKAQMLYADGYTKNEIAMRLSAHPSSVLRWLDEEAAERHREQERNRGKQR